MTVIKLTASKKALLVIDDAGNVFITSLAFLKSLLDGSMKSDFILLSRLPDKASSDRFKPSPLFGEKLPGQEAVVQSFDALSKSKSVERQEEKLFKDQPVW
jgi:hypothetical protein